MDAVSDPEVNVVVVMKSAQTGGTEVINNTVGFHIDRDPAPILVLQPTLDMAQTWSKDRLAPMLRDSPALRGLVKDARARDSNNTVFHKVFPGGHITIVGANSAASLRSRPIRIVVADEVDAYEQSAGREGDPVSLASKRSMTFWNRKLILVSTPTVKGESRIEQSWDKSDQRRYYVRCPRCQHAQVMRWAQVRWQKDEAGESLPSTAAYHCEACEEPWTEGERMGAVMAGEWRAAKPFNGTAGFHLNALVSPWVQLPGLVADFLEAKPFPDRLRVFVNQSLGETWEDSGETREPGGMMKRREAYGPEKIPAGIVALTVGVDVQDNRLEAELLGWGLAEENWSIEYLVAMGDPSTNGPWRLLDDWLLKKREREDGAPLYVGAGCVDTGGHYTQAAYLFCKERAARRIWATKGVGGRERRPIWPKRPSKNARGGTSLFLVGVNAAKDLAHARLKIADIGPGYCHFPDAYDETYFAQLSAEKRVTKYSHGNAYSEWHKISDGARNEAWDCRILNIAAFMGLQSMGLDLTREAERLASIARAIETKAPLPPPLQRRVRSSGVTL